jgi:dTDP-4-amino-4,6-dideoxygalactose transaminase
MKQAGINLQVHYIPVHLQPYYRKQFSFKEGDYSKAEKFYEQEISLPIYPKLTKNDQNLVIDQINHIYAS